MKFNPVLQKSICQSMILANYHPQRSWGKVIFSETCVKNSVHGGACMVGGHAWQGCMRGGGACVVGVCMGGMHGGCMCGGGEGT